MATLPLWTVALVGLGNYSRGQLGPALKLTQHCRLRGVVTGDPAKGVPSKNIAWGKISGAVGTHANVPPEVEELVCAKLGLQPAPVSTQILQYSGPGLEGKGMPPIIGFDFFPRTRVVFGINSVDQLGELARELGAGKALLVTDAGIVAAGHVQRARRALEAAGVDVVVFDEARENPTTRDVDACVSSPLV